jgi:hypothetical protein
MCPLPRRESKANRGDPLQLSYGRIDTHDRTLRQAVQDEAAARKLVGQHLRRRATALGRIGVGYRLSEINDPRQWADACTGQPRMPH